jgi:hypothetical protein
MSDDHVPRRWQALTELDDHRAQAEAEPPPGGWPLALDDEGLPIPEPPPAEPTDVPEDVAHPPSEDDE